MLRAHDVIGAAIRFTRDHRDFGYCCLGERVQELGAIANDSVVLLVRACVSQQNVRTVSVGEQLQNSFYMYVLAQNY